MLIKIHCPRCDVPNVNAEVREGASELDTIEAVAPRARLTFVVCQNCFEEMRLLKLSHEEIPRYDPDFMVPYLQQRTGQLGKMLAGISLLTFFIPFLGMIVSGCGLWVTRKSYGLSRLVCLGTLIVSGFSTFIVVRIIVHRLTGV